MRTTGIEAAVSSQKKKSRVLRFDTCGSGVYDGQQDSATSLNTLVIHPSGREDISRDHEKLPAAVPRGQPTGDCQQGWISTLRLHGPAAYIAEGCL